MSNNPPRSGARLPRSRHSAAIMTTYLQRRDGLRMLRERFCETFARIAALRANGQERLIDDSTPCTHRLAERGISRAGWKARGPRSRVDYKSSHAPEHVCARGTVKQKTSGDCDAREVMRRGELQPIGHHVRTGERSKTSTSNQTARPRSSLTEQQILLSRICASRSCAAGMNFIAKAICRSAAATRRSSSSTSRTPWVYYTRPDHPNTQLRPCTRQFRPIWTATSSPRGSRSGRESTRQSLRLEGDRARATFE